MEEIVAFLCIPCKIFDWFRLWNAFSARWNYENYYKMTDYELIKFSLKNDNI